MGRPRKYATPAERQAAYRSREAARVVEVRLVRETVETLDRIAATFDVSRNEVIHSCVNFALLNRDWFKQGLFGKRLPYAQNPTEET